MRDAVVLWNPFEIKGHSPYKGWQNGTQSFSVL
jgi:hypothetical protein